MSGAGFEHLVLCYQGDDQFVERVGGFVRAGLEREETVLVAEPTRRLGLLQDFLGPDARSVEWLDMTEVGGNPGRIIPVWEQFLAAGTAAGRTVRGVGEPSWPGRRAEELTECRLHELLLNRQFEGGPGWQLLCPYDADGLPEPVLAEALLTHPLQWHEDGAARTAYDPALVEAVFRDPLPGAPEHARTLAFDRGSVEAVRSVLREVGRDCDLAEDRLDELLVAGWEVATNSVRHGGGGGVLRTWREAEALLVQVEDAGLIADPLVGRHLPPLTGLGGRGVYLAHQLCDLVQLRSGPAGTVVRLVTWL